MKESSKRAILSRAPLLLLLFRSRNSDHQRRPSLSRHGARQRSRTGSSSPIICTGAAISTRYSCESAIFVKKKKLFLLCDSDTLLLPKSEETMGRRAGRGREERRRAPARRRARTPRTGTRTRLQGQSEKGTASFGRQRPSSPVHVAAPRIAGWMVCLSPRARRLDGH